MQRIRGSTRMRYTNLLLLTYLLTYFTASVTLELTAEDQIGLRDLTLISSMGLPLPLQFLGLYVPYEPALG